MAEGAERYRWWHTAALAVMVHNMAGKIAKEPLAVEAVYPFKNAAAEPAKADPKAAAAGWAALKTIVQAGGFR